jgi:hypothetical protein
MPFSLRRYGRHCISKSTKSTALQHLRLHLPAKM